MNKQNQFKQVKNIFIITTIIFSLFFILNSSCYAASSTEMGIVLPSDSIAAGDEFTIAIYIDPIVKIGGWEIYLLSFSKEYVSANEVTNGDEWPSTFFDEGNINYIDGTITEIQTWKTQDHPDYNHTACEISFTALAPGECSFEIITAEIANDQFEYISFNTHNATIVITEENIGNDSNIDNQNPVADASASGTSGLVGTRINFDGSLSNDDGTIESFYWDFGDGDTGSGEKTTHIYTESNTYTVKLTVTDDEGASDSVLIIVDIQEAGSEEPPKNENNGDDENNIKSNDDSDDDSIAVMGFDYIVGLELIILVIGIFLFLFFKIKRRE